MKKVLIVVCIVLSILMLGSLTSGRRLSRPSNSARAAEILKFKVPAVVHGFNKTSFLPDGDLFLLPKPFEMAVTDAPAGAKVFPANAEHFGSDPEAMGALPTTEPQGLSFSEPNAKVRAIACAESIWDTNFLIASTPGTDGDTVRLFLEYPDGAQGPELSLFTVKESGIVVTSLHPELLLFVNNRLATGPSWAQGTHIPFSSFAGAGGLRTGLLTFAFPMWKNAALMGCFRIGAEISRGNFEGTTSIVFTDIVVIRNALAGDENNPGLGLLSRLAGGYPTGFPCKDDCPFPTEVFEPPVPNPGGIGSGQTCNAICFRSPQYFLFHVNNLPHGTVLVGGTNHNRPVSTSDVRAMTMALRGGWTPLQKLNQEFLAAQLNALLAGGAQSPKYIFAMEGMLSCYNLKFDPITLSNGFVLSPETKLKDLYQQARFAILDNRTQDMPALTTIFDLLNGNNPLAACNLQPPV